MNRDGTSEDNAYQQHGCIDDRSKDGWILHAKDLYLGWEGNACFALSPTIFEGSAYTSVARYSLVI